MVDLPDPASWAAAETLTGLRVDHVGLVVHDIAPAIAFLAARGFTLTAPTPLQGDAGPLGQVSAHLMLPNAYLEISAPIPGAGNHLDSYLAKGPGLRILALASVDIARDYARLNATGLAAGAPRASARTVTLAAGPATARFEWFPLRANRWPEVLVAVVRHLTPAIAFAPELCHHRNGATRFTDLLIGGDWGALTDPAGGRDALPDILVLPGPVADVRGLTIEVPGARTTVAVGDGFGLRIVGG